MIPMKEEWGVKAKTRVPTLTASENDMDLLDGYPPLIGMDINMVFTLSTEFRGVEEKIT
jgi:hypothetical protein